MSSEDFNFNPVIPDFEKEFTPEQLEEIRRKYEENYELNLSQMVSKKGNLSYISFSDLWRVFKLQFPEAQYFISKSVNGLPYFVDENLGIIVFVKVKAGGQEYEMMLPVMDSQNRALRVHPFPMKVWNKQAKRYETVELPGASMNDVHRTILRAVCKCIAVGWGLSLKLYQGQDFPEITEEIPTEEGTSKPANSVPEPMPQAEVSKQTRRRKSASQPFDPIADLGIQIASMQTIPELVNLYKIHAHEVSTNPEVMAMFSKRRQELEKAA